MTMLRFSHYVPVEPSVPANATAPAIASVEPCATLPAASSPQQPPAEVVAVAPFGLPPGTMPVVTPAVRPALREPSKDAFIPTGGITPASPPIVFSGKTSAGRLSWRQALRRFAARLPLGSASNTRSS